MASVAQLFATHTLLVQTTVPSAEQSAFAAQAIPSSA
jgi:hypothetical protein